MSTEARRAERRIKPLTQLQILFIGIVLGCLIVPLVARAITLQEPSHYPQSSETHGYALEAHGSMNSESDTSPLDLSQELATDTYEDSVVSALDEQEMLDYIEQKESKGNHLAQNKHSTAFGRFQFLDSTWGLVGCTKTSDPIEQERCARIYMDAVYGGIEGAYYHHLSNGWY